MSGARRSISVRPLACLKAALAGVLVAATLAAGALYATTPGVGGAEARTAARLRLHDSRTVGPELPARLTRATVAVEDARFYRHGAVDPLALARAAVQGIVPGGGDPGGSTITQQLAKVLYLHGDDDLLAQAQAVTVAFKLESDYSKRQILEMYLDDVYYGHGYWGARAASEGYFGVRPDRLSWGQASMLAALPQAPSAFDPLRHHALARAAQEHVLDRLQATGALSAAAATRAFAATSLRVPGPGDEAVASRPAARAPAAGGPRRS